MGADAAYLISYGVGDQLNALNWIEYQNQTRCFGNQYENARIAQHFVIVLRKTLHSIFITT